jgi:Pyruvate/2-oxoacid:ferredoxin oxidoreductase gamma subunit
MLENLEVTWFPSYGAEMRGGTANCTVVLSNEPIGSPIVTNPDILIVMNEESLKKFQPGLKKEGLIIFDSSLICNPYIRTDIHHLGIPATAIANIVGNKKSANMVLFGLLIAKTGLLRTSAVFEALGVSIPERRKKFIEINKKALLEGIRYFEDKKSKDI